MECEYADGDFLVLMATPENSQGDLDRAAAAWDRPPALPGGPLPCPWPGGNRSAPIRQAAFSPRETVDASRSLGRVCGLPTVGCPPAVPIAVSGERITPEALALFQRYGIEQVDVLLPLRKNSPLGGYPPRGELLFVR